MFTFAVRPSYKSKDLLIDFREGSGSDEMISAMKAVLAEADIKVIGKLDLWQNDEMLYKIDSKFGKFEISSDNWGCVFILAPDNQPAINSLASLFSESSQFQKEEVDFEQYT